MTTKATTKAKKIMLPRTKVVGYITNEQLEKPGFEMLGFFDGNYVYKKID